MASKTLSKPQSDLVTSAAFDPASAVSLEETIEDFIREYRAREAAKATIYRYKHYLTDYAGWLDSEGLPTDMGSLQGKRGLRHVQGNLAYMRREKAAAPGTVATAFRALKTFWNWAVRESLDEDNEPSIPPFVRRSPIDFLAKTETPRDVVADDVGDGRPPIRTCLRPGCRGRRFISGSDMRFMPAQGCHDRGGAHDRGRPWRR